jgi:hypothetical protein
LLASFLRLRNKGIEYSTSARRRDLSRQAPLFAEPFFQINLALAPARISSA